MSVFQSDTRKYRRRDQRGVSGPTIVSSYCEREPVMKRFDNRTVIVTGGARGMGASHARGFVAEGANVVIADVLEQEGRTLADKLGVRAIFSRLDVTSESDWSATVAAAESAFGPVSVLVNNAGIVRFGPIAGTEPAAWRLVIDINLTGTYLGIRAIVPTMRKAGGGAIVNISSAGGMMAYPNTAAYTASKWGVRGLTKTAALELGRDGIRVNSIHPGPVRTPMTAGPDVAAAVAAEARNLAIARVAEPDEITRMVLFVASDEASFSTGSEFIVDGGVLLGPAPQHERARAAVA
jgi:3alpha(or 20beta)-hydroxysteroid dehydrogenase